MKRLSLLQPRCPVGISQSCLFLRRGGIIAVVDELFFFYKDELSILLMLLRCQADLVQSIIKRMNGEPSTFTVLAALHILSAVRLKWTRWRLVSDEL